MTWKRCTRKRLLFLSSALVPATDRQDTLDFFSLLTSKLAEKLSSQFDVVLRVPKDNRSGAQQAGFLTQAIQTRHCYDAFVIAPIETAALKSTLITFMRSNPKYPILTIDKNFEIHIHDFDGCPPPSVTVDGKKGGSLAGNALRQYCSFNKNPSVRILQGLEGAEARVEGFMNAFGGLPGAVKTHTRLSFDTPSARDRVALDLKNRDFCDAYFCTNDEMALGVREALISFERNGGQWPEARPPVVVGFDGIGTVRRLIEKDDKHMYGTVDVHLEEQVGLLSKLIDELLIEGKPFGQLLADPQKRIKIVEPTYHGRS